MNSLDSLRSSAAFREDRAFCSHDLVIASVIAVHELLASESDISPRNRKIGAPLRGLVELLLRSYEPAEASAILNHAAVARLRPSLRARLAEAESALEFYWAHRFLSRPTLRLIDLEEFTYWRSYERLLGAELQMLTKIRWRLNAPKGKAIVFVGGGALPLSAIVLHMLTGEPVICLDSDAAAFGCASKLLAKLHLSNAVAAQMDGAAYDYKDASAVFIASLAARKTSIARRIAETCEDPVVAVRSVEGARALLYAPADLAALKAEGLCLLGQTRPGAEAVNNTLFFNVCPLRTARPDGCDGAAFD